MTFRYPAESKPHPPPRTVSLYRLDTIDGTSGIEPAMSAKQRGQRVLCLGFLLCRCCLRCLGFCCCQGFRLRCGGLLGFLFSL